MSQVNYDGPAHDATRYIKVDLDGSVVLERRTQEQLNNIEMKILEINKTLNWMVSQLGELESRLPKK